MIANPQAAVQTSASYIPGMDQSKALSVLQATIPVWQGDGHVALGVNDSATWQSMTQFLVASQIIPQPADLSKAYTNQFVS